MGRVVLNRVRNCLWDRDTCPNLRPIIRLLDENGDPPSMRIGQRPGPFLPYERTLPPAYSITLSARARSDGGIVKAKESNGKQSSRRLAAGAGLKYHCTKCEAADSRPNRH
jgi:hypothetical protein